MQQNRKVAIDEREHLEEGEIASDVAEQIFRTDDTVPEVALNRENSSDSVIYLGPR